MTKNEIFKKIGIDVSRETFSMLETYVETLEKWQKAINLVGKSTLDDVWNRHIIDSAQLYPYISGEFIADLGSGAGFPGMVLAILMPEKKFYLIESDIRKCEFLREIKRKCNINNVDIINDRIENIKELKFDCIVSRALASVEKLIALSKNIIKSDTFYLFLKGEKIEEEIKEAENNFVLKYDIYDSITNNNGKILKIQEVK